MSNKILNSYISPTNIDNVVQPWISEHDYKVNQLIFSINTIYKCLTVHTSTTSFIADLSNANWISMSGDIADIKIITKNTVPNGWLACYGQPVSRTTYSALFNIIGTVFGVGDGTTTFNLPDFRGKIPVGLDSTQTEFSNMGKVGGEKLHLLSTPELPSHNHGVQGYSRSNYNQGGSQVSVTTSGNYYTNSTGNNAKHNNLQPYMVLNYIIKY